MSQSNETGNSPTESKNDSPQSAPADRLQLLELIARAALHVAQYNWGTSVPENYHFVRMGAMDHLRDLVGGL